MLYYRSKVSKYLLSRELSERCASLDRATFHVALNVDPRRSRASMVVWITALYLALELKVDAVIKD